MCKSFLQLVGSSYNFYYLRYTCLEALFPAALAVLALESGFHDEIVAINVAEGTQSLTPGHRTGGGGGKE